jgi:hypothetical protein
VTNYIALCRRCGNSYDVNFEPVRACHVGDDDWDLLITGGTEELDAELLDLTDRWHDGAFDDHVTLDAVICARTGWSQVQYENWVRTADPDDDTWPPQVHDWPPGRSVLH